MIKKATQSSSGTFSGTLASGGTFSTASGSAMTLSASVANSGTNVAFTFNNSVALSGTTKLFSFTNNGTEKLSLGYDGTLLSGSHVSAALGSATIGWGAAYLHTLTMTGKNIFGRDAGHSIEIAGYVNDGASAIANKMGSRATLTTAGAAIVAFYNDENSTKKSFIDKDGQYENAVTGKGIILKSPDGTRYLLTIANGGTVSIATAP